MIQITRKEILGFTLLSSLFLTGITISPFITMAVGYFSAQSLLIVALVFAARKTPPAFIPQRRAVCGDGKHDLCEALAA